MNGHRDQFLNRRRIALSQTAVHVNSSFELADIAGFVMGFGGVEVEGFETVFFSLAHLFEKMDGSPEDKSSKDRY